MFSSALKQNSTFKLSETWAQNELLQKTSLKYSYKVYMSQGIQDWTK